MIRYREGNILDDSAEAIVNPVNCVGVMGAGLAKQFRERFPLNDRVYRADCEAGWVRVWRMHVTATCYAVAPYWIVNFPTKEDWRDPSRLGFIGHGLEDLAGRVIPELKIRSIAIPMLGCGLGGLRWRDVRPLIERAFAPLPRVDVRVYGPPA